jgi:hypothetical protein
MMVVAEHDLIRKHNGIVKRILHEKLFSSASVFTPGFLHLKNNKTGSHQKYSSHRHSYCKSAYRKAGFFGGAGSTACSARRAGPSPWNVETGAPPAIVAV